MKSAIPYHLQGSGFHEPMPIYSCLTNEQEESGGKTLIWGLNDCVGAVTKHNPLPYGAGRPSLPWRQSHKSSLWAHRSISPVADCRSSSQITLDPFNWLYVPLLELLKVCTLNSLGKIVLGLLVQFCLQELGVCPLRKPSVSAELMQEYGGSAPLPPA